MSRIPNPYYGGSPYPTDPTGAIVGQALGQALFGDPEMAAQAKLRRAQMEQASANAAESQAHAGLYGAQTTGVDIGNNAISTENLNKLGYDPRMTAAIQARGTGAGGMDAADIAKGSAGLTEYDYWAGKLKQPAGGLGSRLLGPSASADGVDADGNPVVSVVGRKFNPDEENAHRGLAMIFTGNLPTENTAVTVGQADRHQRAELQNKLDVENVQSGDRRYAADSSAGASRYNADRDYQASIYGDNLRAVVARAAAGAPRGVGTLAKEQGAEVDAITTASNLSTDINSLRSQIGSGQLKLGPYTNLISEGRNALGNSDENSRNYASFRATVERIRNDSLRLNKGTQTEGDAVRAANELLANINDPHVVMQRLSELEALNRRAAAIHTQKLDMTRSLYGLGSADVSTMQSQPAAVGAQGPSGGAPVRVRTPAEAMALPPGTIFMTPDGRKKVR